MDSEFYKNYQGISWYAWNKANEKPSYFGQWVKDRAAQDNLIATRETNVWMLQRVGDILLAAVGAEETCRRLAVTPAELAAWQEGRLWDERMRVGWREELDAAQVQWEYERACMVIEHVADQLGLAPAPYTALAQVLVEYSHKLPYSDENDDTGQWIERAAIVALRGIAADREIHRAV